MGLAADTCKEGGLPVFPYSVLGGGVGPILGWEALSVTSGAEVISVSISEGLK
jgi:hypothetical protein